MSQFENNFSSVHISIVDGWTWRGIYVSVIVVERGRTCEALQLTANMGVCTTLKRRGGREETAASFKFGLPSPAFTPPYQAINLGQFSSETAPWLLSCVNICFHSNTGTDNSDPSQGISTAHHHTYTGEGFCHIFHSHDVHAQLPESHDKTCLHTLAPEGCVTLTRRWGPK